MTEKQARKELALLEGGGRVSKVPMRKKENGRICAGWVIADRDKLPPEILDVCQACGERKASESFGDERLCLRCFKAVKHNGRRILLTTRQEVELSIYLATIVTIPNENTLG